MSGTNDSSKEYPDACYPAGQDFRDDLTNSLDGSNIILVGAPTVGKSWEIGQLVAETEEAALVCSSYEQEEKNEIASKFSIQDRAFTLDECAYASRYDYVILDDFYKIVEESVRRRSTNDADPELALLDLLNTDNGICISTTPYRWNTLNGISPTEDTDTHWERLNHVKERLPFFSADSEDDRPDLSQSTAENYTEYVTQVLGENVRYRYLCYLNDEDAEMRFQDVQTDDSMKQVSSEAFPTYEAPVYQQDGNTFMYESTVPFALFFFSREIVEELVSEAEETVKIIGHIKGGEKLEHAIEPLFERVPDSHLARGLLPNAPNALASTPAPGPGMLASVFLLGIEATSFTALGVLIHLLFSTLRGGPEELESVKERFGGLLRLTPPQMELIEQEAGLEPLTLEGYREWVVNPEKREELERLVRTHEEELEQLRNDVTIPLEDLSVFDDQAVGELAGRLDRECRSSDVLEVMIEEAVRNPDDTLYTYDSLLDYLGETTVDEASELEPADSPYVDKIVDNICDEDRETPVVLVRGPVGSGKTTAVYQATTELRDRGFFVATTDLSDLGTVRFVLDNVSESSVLVVDDFHEVPIRSVKTALTHLSDGVYDNLVVLCRTRHFPNVDAELDDALSTTGLAEQQGYWTNAKQKGIDVMGLPEETAIEFLQHNFGGYSLDEMEIILEYSRRNAQVNPLFAVITADALATDVDIERHENVERLLWNKVRPFFNQNNWDGDADLGRALLLSYASAARTLSDDDMTALLRGQDLMVNPAELVADIDSYLSKTNSKWTVRPALLQTLIFMNHCLDRLDARPDEILRHFTGRDAIIGVATNLAELHLRGYERQRCQKYANQLIKTVGDEWCYYRCLEELAKGHIPVDPEALNPDQLVGGVAQTTTRIEESFMIFPNLTISYFKSDQIDNFDALYEIYREVAEKYQQQYEIQSTDVPDWNLRTLASMAFRSIEQGYDEGKA